MLVWVGTTTAALPTCWKEPPRYSRTARQRLHTIDTVEACVMVRKVPQAGHEADLATIPVLLNAQVVTAGSGSATAPRSTRRTVTFWAPSSWRSSASQFQRGRGRQQHRLK